MNYKQKALLAIFLSAVIGGATSPITKVGLYDIPPLSFAFLRFLISFLLILPFIWKQKHLFLGSFTALIPLSLFAVANIIFFVLGIKLTTSNISQVLYAAVPSLVALYLFLFFHERINSRKVGGIVLGFLGACIVVLLPILEKNSAFSGNLLGNFFVCLAVLSWSQYMIRSKQMQNRYSPLTVTAHFIVVTMIIVFPMAVIESAISPSWIYSLTLTSMSALLYVSIAATIISYFLYQYAIKHGGSVFASMIFYIQPLIAFYFAYILLGERLTPGIIIGGLFVIGGVYLVTKK